MNRPIAPMLSRSPLPAGPPAPSAGEAPTWRRVRELADLVEIFDPAVQVCVWQRPLDAAIHGYLSGLDQPRSLQVIETLSAHAGPQLAALSAGAGRAALMDELSFLREILCDLLGCTAVGLRLARLDHAMCPGWHMDRTGIRMICTYQGPGTQWLQDQGVDRCQPGLSRMADGASAQAASGEVVLLKGSLWQGNRHLGAIHRSPEPPPDAAGPRTLVTLDPLWQE